MNEKSSKSLNILVSIGILLFTYVCVFYSFSARKNIIDILCIILLSFQIIIGSIICTLATIRTKKASHLFLGSIFVFWGALSILINYILPFTIRQCWPIFGICAGILLFCSGLFKYRKIKFGYGIPAITLCCCCIWFSLFSFKIIKISFLSIAGTLGPLFMLLIAIILIVYFLLQQKHKELIISDEDTGVFLDEDPVLPNNE